jgi:DNA polymerase-1
LKYGKLDLKDKSVAFDTETTGLNPWGDFKRWGYYPARPFAFSMCDLEGNTHFIRWQVDPFTRQVIPNNRDLPFLQDILEDERITKIGHNLGFDVRMTEMTGIKVRGKIHDTLILMHVVTGGGEIKYALKYLSKKFLDIDDKDEKDLQESTIKGRARGKKLGWHLAKEETHGKEHIRADYWMADPKILETYAVQDAERTATLFLMAKEDIETDEGLYDTYKMEMDLFWEVKAMEDRGTRILPEKVKELHKFYADYMAKQKAIADANGGKGLNFNSYPQKVKKFITERGHKPLTYTKTGPSINGDFLLAISGKDPLAKAVLEYTAAEKAISTFLEPYQEFMVEENGVWVLHPNFKQVGPVTGRMACTDPNLMQVGSESSAKKKADIALMPRRAFGPRPGHIWYAPDYSQQEIWIAMFHAQEITGMKILLSGQDFHAANTEGAWNTQPDFAQNKQKYRKRTKIIIFTKFYGGGVSKIALELNCTEDEAREFIDRINSQLPGIEAFMRRKTREARNNGFIRTPFGRKITVDTGFAYKGMNYDIQGTAIEMVKRSQLHLRNDVYSQPKWAGVFTLMNLHDELIIEVPLELHSKRLMREIIAAMQKESKAAGIPVPIPVSMKLIPSNWSEEIKLCDKHLDIKCKSCEKK